MVPISGVQNHRIVDGSSDRSQRLFGTAFLVIGARITGGGLADDWGHTASSTLDGCRALRPYAYGQSGRAGQLLSANRSNGAPVVLRKPLPRLR